MTSYVSQCPNCDTSFKVTESQLAAADGAVRCGACLEVFVASDYFVEAPIPDLFEQESEQGAELIAEDLPEAPQEVATPEVEDSGTPDVDAPPADPAQPIDHDSLEVEPPIAPEDINLDSVSDRPLDEIVGNVADPIKRQRRWVFLATLAALLLALQYAWFERESLSANPNLRPYYLSVCNLMGCELKDYHDPARLYTTDLLVRSHPEDSQGLTVDAILRNEAAYRQRFPRLELAFSNIEGQVIARREFLPAAYLGGEMAGLLYIPAVTEVRLSLDIVDPGPEAVSYRMRTVFN